MLEKCRKIAVEAKAVRKGEKIKLSEERVEVHTEAAEGRKGGL